MHCHCLKNKRFKKSVSIKLRINLGKVIKSGNREESLILAAGSGKTYLACLASYRMLNYTATKRVLFLVDRNNLARQTEVNLIYLIGQKSNNL